MSEQKASNTTVILHWLVATSVLFLFISSWWMLGLPLPSENFTYRELPFQLHKNIGITILIAIVVMIAARIRQKRKQPKSILTRTQKLAELEHLLTYLLIVAVCLSGYMSSSYSGWETTIWWFIDLPAWTAENDQLNILFSDIHKWTCWALLAAILLHIGAALYHGFADDGVIDKMFKLRSSSDDEALK